MDEERCASGAANVYLRCSMGAWRRPFVTRSGLPDKTALSIHFFMCLHALHRAPFGGLFGLFLLVVAKATYLLLSRMFLYTLSLLALLRHIGSLGFLHVLPQIVVPSSLALVSFLFLFHQTSEAILSFYPLHCNLGLFTRSCNLVLMCMDHDLQSANPSLLNIHCGRAPICRIQAEPLDFHTLLIVAACISLSLLVYSGSPGNTKSAPKKFDRLHLFMAVLAVIESWLLIHTVFTLRYAHVFYPIGAEG